MKTSRNIGKIVDQLIQKFDETGEASVLLIDEIDHFQKIRANQALKKLILFFKKLNGVEIKFFIGTTNELESLPDSLTRDGRMGTVIHFEHCDAKSCKKKF